ncbi:GFA family protein [Novosphingobium album (ex Liu et al. 2023)]|uniref:GFA family protein n=1 Tax=Novosphingobium album (ex Liu et al. 2023) TaxID=3031130 RepID=A0ABT5WSE6_9SPHN|nr:GFA family protein [Novosphingobium album (ex Liu et al. 2023)]MDE8652969.1 GFA family protein [Novosphingobium album (ex Liu et al. 2023)]
MTRAMTGGCQCGRIRYTALLADDEAYLCHCRMCQRATGGFAAAFVHVPADAVTWEHEPDWYDSSPIARRPFCAGCGTPLGFRFRDGGGMDLTVGSFDDPSAFVPVAHAGAESLHAAWLDTRDLPRQYSATTESVAKRWKAAGLAVPE